MIHPAAWPTATLQGMSSVSHAEGTLGHGNIQINTKILFNGDTQQKKTERGSNLLSLSSKQKIISHTNHHFSFVSSKASKYINRINW